jgi:aspartate dehydrogenase
MSMPRFQLGLIGYGAIGQRVVGVLNQHGRHIDVVAILLRPNSPHRLASTGMKLVDDIGVLCDIRPDLVLECAGQQALASYGPAVLAAGIDLVVASVGALADAVLQADLARAAEAGHARLILPPGAVGGLDALEAMKLAGPIQVIYRSRKPPAAWRDSPAEGLCDLGGLTAPTVFWRGSARDAALAYPKNANVAAAIGLAGTGLDDTEVELMADPGIATNTHEIEASGPSGRMVIRLDGLPDPLNPKTSMLTSYSLARAVLGQARG